LHGVGLKSSEVIANVRSIVSRLAPKAPIMDVTAQTIRTKTNGLSQQDSANALLYTLNRFAESHGEDFTIESISNGYDEMLTKTVEQIESFRSILNEEMFDIAYQPIVDIKTGVIHHYECLVRLKEAAPKDFSNPFHFITFGESSGLINEFDLLMADKTLHMLQGEVKKGKKPLVSVNLSGRSLSSSLFMDSFERMMEAQPQVRKQLILEITESSKITDLKLANNFVQKLRKEGNLVCLDDFGSGESSFDYLRSLQVDFIKIDGSYVKESMQSQHGRDMLRAMAGLCRALNIVTIGEMVEDEKCAHFLWESGIKFGQGYYFGKPTTELATLENFKKILPNYPEIVRAKRFEVSNRPWWARRDQ
ncbi:MAG: EAL domain-containing protein, partial [Rickettsiales bacterium]|nr:EAL domain-containing protein [Rickettsiales bacterium]